MKLDTILCEEILYNKFAPKSLSLIAFIAVSFNGMAQSQSTYNFSNNSKSSSKSGNFSGSLSMQANQLIDDVGLTAGNQYYGDVELNYESVDSDMEKVLKTSARSNSRGQLMYSLSEGYIHYKFENSDLKLGRAVLPWSEADKNWGLGKLNNRINFDYYEPGEEGLAGVSYLHRFNNGISVNAFLSPIYVPEMNPGQTIDKKNGKILCENPWCRKISDSAPISDTKNTPIFYTVDYPEISDVIFRYTTGVNVAFENKSKSFEVSAYVVRKPENQISVSAEISYDVDQDIIFADVTPQFYYHEVFGGDIKLKPGYIFSDEGSALEGLTLYGTALSVRPEHYPDGKQQYIEYTGIKPEKKKEDYLGAGAIYEFGKHALKIGYIARTSSFDIENEILAEAPRWNQAFNIGFLTELSQKIGLNFDYKTDMLTEDRIVMFKASYKLSPSLIGAVGINTIGVKDPKSFWADFENNDQAYASLKYVF